MDIVVETVERTEVIQVRGSTTVEDRGGGRVGSAGLGESKKILFTPLAPATPTVVDTVPVSSGQSVKWLITLVNGSDARGYREIAATNTAGAAQFSGAHAFRDVPFTVDVNVVSGNYELEITNDDAGPVDVHIIRIA